MSGVKREWWQLWQSGDHMPPSEEAAPLSSSLLSSSGNMASVLSIFSKETSDPVFRQLPVGWLNIYAGLSSQRLDCSCIFFQLANQKLILFLCSFLFPGHYIYVDTSFGKQGEKAVLLSSDLQAEEWSCLRLVYQITTSSESLSDPSQLNLYMRFEDESFDRLLWSAKEPSDSWLIASLDLQNSSKKFKVGGV